MLDSLRDLIEECRFELPEGLPPMASCLLGYLGYDTVRLMEGLPDSNPSAIDVPDGLFIRPTVVAVFDRVEDLVTVFTPVWPRDDVSARAAYAQACERLADVAQDFERALPQRRDIIADLEDLPDPGANLSRDTYLDMVARAKDYILAGDIFQVVLSQRLSLPFKLPPFALYRALRRLNPSPFLFFIDFGGFAIVGSSPEILVRLRDDTVTIRPIAGTRPRGATPAEDRELADDLLSDPKELDSRSSASSRSWPST